MGQPCRCDEKWTSRDRRGSRWTKSCYGRDGRMVGVIDRTGRGSASKLLWSPIEFDASGVWHETGWVEEPPCSQAEAEKRAEEIGRDLLRRAGCDTALGCGCRRGR